MVENLKVDREKFTNAVRNLITTPPLPKDAIPRKRSKTARQKAKPAARSLKSPQ